MERCNQYDYSNRVTKTKSDLLWLAYGSSVPAATRARHVLKAEPHKRCWYPPALLHGTPPARLHIREGRISPHRICGAQYVLSVICPGATEQLER